MNKKDGSRTLLLSVIMSAPGPLVVGLGLLAGRSTTQLADFVRRSAELAAILVSFVVYRMTGKDADAVRKARLERRCNLAVGCAMCLGGGAMLLLALLNSNTEKGNVIPGLAIALLGVVANSLFWRKYTRLAKEGGGAILAIQARLYRAKALVDGCVTAALVAVLLVPGTSMAYWLDKVGSAVVALYLIWCGVRTLRENWRA